MLSTLAGKLTPDDLLVDLAQLEREYFEREPDTADPKQRVAFGTSGHRGTSLDGTFTEAHVLAITQAVCDYRRGRGINGPVYLGMDTHALSVLAHRTALEVLAANGAETIIQHGDLPTPTPVISWAILNHNRGRAWGMADGLILTPSHNPPEDGGIKYNPPNGGPADTEVTSWIQERANALLRADNTGVKLTLMAFARKAKTTAQEDFVLPYVYDLAKVIDMEAIRAAGLRIGVDPLGGAAGHYWEPIAEIYGLNITVVNKTVDPTFSFMPADHDGKIRMDCSSPQAMARLVGLKHGFDIAFGNDPDADRHGIVTPSVGLMNPNHFLAVAVRYLLANRPHWPVTDAVGKTVVSSTVIDRVVWGAGRRLVETPVGFKWFAAGLFDGSVCFGGEESAGASFLRHDGTVWTTDKDGLIMGLLAAEITARTGKDPGQHYQDLVRQVGETFYTRDDAPATPTQKERLRKLAPEDVPATELAGEPILTKLTKAPGNDAPIGGLKIIAERGWFAARPSGTENVIKIYAESYRSEHHLRTILAQAQRMLATILEAS
jgi:phosphoglucomutase